jgi:hypothetical protein
MKKLLLLTTLALTHWASAQAPEKCGSMQAYQQQLQHPVHGPKTAAVQAAANHWLANNPGAGSNRSVITIPVVVHVVYKNAAQNITDQQVYSQIAVLNQDFRRLNADTINTPAIFDTIAADMGVEFCLATTDPNGNPTNGITRTSTTGGQLFGFFGPFDDVKAGSTGGIDPWPTDKYFNIWVCELFPGLLGYAQFPGGDPMTDGVVITYNAFGTIGTVQAPALLGRTTTHEVGHWFGLYHIWGDDQDCTTGIDSIPDTPNAAAASQSDCNVTLNSCSNEDPYWGSVDPPDMVQNYMDYSNDSCMNMFTLGQRARAYSFLATDTLRIALLNSNVGCNPLGIVNTTIDKYFSFYPNPSDGMINVSYFGNLSGIIQYDVYSITGQWVKGFTAGPGNTQLNLEDLQPGVYSVRITNNNESGVQRIVIQ